MANDIQRLRKILLNFGHAWDISLTYGEAEVDQAIKEIQELERKEDGQH